MSEDLFLEEAYEDRMTGDLVMEDNWEADVFEFDVDIPLDWDADTMVIDTSLLDEIRQAEMWGHISDEEY